MRVASVSKSRVCCVGYVAYNAQTHTKFWSENLKVRDRLGDLCVDGRIIL
jgi:hypothetical protein